MAKNEFCDINNNTNNIPRILEEMNNKQNADLHHFTS